ncbi:MAG: hypothetical protein MUE32_07035 [Bacteroidales bacterium]|nr:hypothetical protein [Bacteroidales bacterium]
MSSDYNFILGWLKIIKRLTIKGERLTANGKTVLIPSWEGLGWVIQGVKDSRHKGAERRGQGKSGEQIGMKDVYGLAIYSDKHAEQSPYR